MKHVLIILGFTLIISSLILYILLSICHFDDLMTAHDKMIIFWKPSVGMLIGWSILFLALKRK